MFERDYCGKHFYYVWLDDKLAQVNERNAQLLGQCLLNLIFLDDTPGDQDFTECALALFLLLFQFSPFALSFGFT